MPEPTRAAPIRVLLADDHTLVRAGLRAVLEGEPDLAVVAEAASGPEAVDLAAAGGVDVVLMDLQFGSGPGPHGVEATAAITAMAEGPRVLILTTYDSDADILAAIQAGATGYLLKDADPDALAEAVRGAAAGRTMLGPSISARLADRVRRPAPAMSPRELEVLAQVAAGRSNREIAAVLHLTEATVKSHLVHVFTKLGVDSRTAAVAAAREQGILRATR